MGERRGPMGGFSAIDTQFLSCLVSLYYALQLTHINVLHNLTALSNGS